MVLCIIALVVFGILGIWSAKYRTLAKEAFDCVFRSITLRPCTSKLDQRIKSKLTAKMLIKSPKLAKLFHKNYRAISWIFVLAFFLSTGGVFYGLYNYVAFGNCNGQGSGFCIYKAFSPATMSPKDIAIGDHPVRGTGNLTIIEFACLQCPYSKAAEPAVRQVLDSYNGKINLAFFFFPLPQHAHGQLAAAADYCAEEQGKFWEYHDFLFEKQNDFSNSMTDTQAMDVMTSAAEQLELELNEFSACLDSSATKDKIRKDIELGKKLGITGTPTFFIGNDVLVGPKTFAEFRSVIEKQTKK